MGEGMIRHVQEFSFVEMLSASAPTSPFTFPTPLTS